MSKRKLQRCLKPREVAGYARGLLDDRAIDLAADHLETCARCSSAVEEYEAQADQLTNRLRSPRHRDPYLEEAEFHATLRLLKVPNSVGDATQTPSAANQGRIPLAPPTPPAEIPIPSAPVSVKPAAVAPVAAVQEPAQPSATKDWKKPASGRKRKPVPPIVGILGVAAFGIFTVMYFGRRSDPATTTNGSIEPVVPAVSAVNPEQNPVPTLNPAPVFRMGELSPEELIETIRVTLKVGPDGNALNEATDVHLGLGFPLRLHPVGSETRDPGFAAYPHTTSLEEFSGSIEPGTEAWFEFKANPNAPGNDALQATPQLLDGMTVGDIHSIGVASAGQSDWVLAGYTIEINGKLFAASDGINRLATKVLDSIDREYQEHVPAHAALAEEVANIAAYVETGFASEEDQASLEKQRRELDALDRPLQQLARVLDGADPWYVEQNPAFTAGGGDVPLPKSIQVTLVTASDEQAGSRNPVYLWAGGRKLPLTSEKNPLADESALQKFSISTSELSQNPMSLKHLQSVGIGMVGSDHPFDQVPDRAKLQRVIVAADEEIVYDSETSPGDRNTLASVWLVPPAHRDDLGTVVQNIGTDNEWHLWKAGSELASDVIVEITPENPPDDVTGSAEDLVASNNGTTPPGRGLATPTGMTTPGNGLTPPGNGLTAPNNGLIANAGSGMPGSGRSFVRTVYRPSRNQKPGLPRIVIYVPPPIIIKTIPPKGKPAINNVRINPMQWLVEDTRRTTVGWTVSGTTSNVKDYQVELFAMLPHRSPPQLTTPVARVRVRSRSANLTPDLTKVAGSIPAQELPYLFVRPKVTARDFKGRPLASTFGPMRPIFPKGSQTQAVVFQRGPLPAGPPIPRIEFSGNGVVGPWTAFGKPNAWAPEIQDSHAGLKFDGFKDVWNVGEFEQNSGILPPVSPANHVAIRFDAENVTNLSNRMRLVAHVGFIDGSPSIPASADIGVRVVVGHRASGPHPQPASDATFEFFEHLRVETIAPIRISKATLSRRMELIDVPIRFATPVHGLDTSRYLVDAATPLPATRPPIAPFGATVRVTFFVNGVGPTRHAVGIFGMRLVRD